jgi:phosphate transport system substrate-binding protein
MACLKKLLLIAYACLLTSAYAQSSLIKIDGSSTVFPITDAVIEDFKKTNKSVKATLGISGTGGGFKKFCRNELDVVNASRPISSKEMAACKEAGVEYIELPIGYDALTVVVNPKNTWVSSLSTNELKLMWEPAAQGKIRSWQQINPAFPDVRLKLYGAGSDSGTFDYFTAVINGKVGASRGDYSPTEDDHETVAGVATNVNAIGYLGLAYFEESQHKLKGVAISWNGKNPIYPSAKNVLDGTYQPLSRPILIYVNAASLNKPVVKAFALHYLNNASKLVKKEKYVELSSNAYKLGLARINNTIKGTSFDGENQNGLKVEDVMSRPTRQ